MFGWKKKKDAPATVTETFNEAVLAHHDIKIYRDPETKNVSVRNLTLKLPHGETLVTDFSMELKPGDRLALTGPSGCGKSTLLKAMGGLWPVGEGDVIWPTQARVLSITQKPHLAQTDLQGILSYPQPAGTYTREEMESALVRARHKRLIDKLDDRDTDGVQYDRQLSGGERQRLVFARVLLQKPDILLLDEITAALDVKSGNELYGLIMAELPDTIIISVAHQENIIPFHTLIAEIGEDKHVTFRQQPPRNVPPPEVPGLAAP